MHLLYNKLTFVYILTARGGKLRIDSHGKNIINCLENGWQHSYMHVQEVKNIINSVPERKRHIIGLNIMWMESKLKITNSLLIQRNKFRLLLPMQFAIMVQGFYITLLFPQNVLDFFSSLNFPRHIHQRWKQFPTDIFYINRFFQVFSCHHIRLDITKIIIPICSISSLSTKETPKPKLTNQQKNSTHLLDWVAFLYFTEQRMQCISKHDKVAKALGHALNP